MQFSLLAVSQLCLATSVFLVHVCTCPGYSKLCTIQCSYLFVSMGVLYVRMLKAMLCLVFITFVCYLCPGYSKLCYALFGTHNFIFNNIMHMDSAVEVHYYLVLCIWSYPICVYGAPCYVLCSQLNLYYVCIMFIFLLQYMFQSCSKLCIHN